jgi:hypothetical protein
MSDNNLISHFGLNLSVATMLIIATVIIHLLGLSILTFILRAREWRHEARNQTPHPFKEVLTILFVVLGIFATHGVEIWLYAIVYHWGFGLFHDIEEAVYFSIENFIALGYGDLFLPKQWRVVGALESVNGLVLVGWSTAFLVTIVGRARIMEHEWVETIIKKHILGETDKNN